MSEKKRPVFSYNRCMSCGVCVSACPFGCLDDTKTGIGRMSKRFPELSRPEDCTGCGICAGECPFNAIAMSAAVS